MNRSNPPNWIERCAALETLPAGKVAVGDMIQHGDTWGTVTDITADHASDQLLISWLSDDGEDDAVIAISGEECSEEGGSTPMS